MALKEMSIRGEFVTPIEYLIALLESDEYVCCKFSTDWLGEYSWHKYCGCRFQLIGLLYIYYRYTYCS